MDKKCVELLKYNGKSLVEVRFVQTNELKEYVVCSDFNNAKAYGNKWSNGTYFTPYGGDEEEQLKAATMYLYNIKEPSIPYERMSEIATRLKDELMAGDKASTVDFMKNEIELSREEARYFELEDELYPPEYDVYEVEMKREQKCTIKVVVPKGKDPYYLDDYIDSYYMEADWDGEGEWEVDDYDEYEMGISKEYFKDNYNEETCWNAD